MQVLKKTLILCALLGAAGSAFAQVKLPDPSLPGGSMVTAVRLVATSELMIERSIKRWLRTHYPGWDSDPYEIQDMAGERYAVVWITAPNNPGRRVYFRVVTNQNDPDAGGAFPF
jgi:hypothetical protein